MVRTGTLTMVPTAIELRKEGTLYVKGLVNPESNFTSTNIVILVYAMDIFMKELCEILIYK